MSVLPPKKLPVHFPPEPDELFSSWLVRLATAHHIKLHSFSKYIFGNRRIWNRDIDQSADSDHLGKLMEFTGCDYERIYSSTLRYFEGRLYEKHNPGGNLRWVMPIGIHRQIRRRFGLQMCPLCLSEDKEPYFRLLWRISCVSVCVKHEILLLDRCCDCQTPLMFHRGDMGWRNQPVSLSMVRCSECDLCWTSRKTLKSLTEVVPDAVNFQKKLEHAIHSNWFYVQKFGYVHSINFFNGLRNILRILSINRQASDFRREAACRSNLPLGEAIEDDNRAFSFEHLPVLHRYKTLRLASWLIEDWSDKFIDIAKKTKLYISALLPYQEAVPFWYWSPIYNHLVKKSYAPSEEEIRSALLFLTRTKPLTVIKDLKNLLGREIFSGKTERFIISIYEEMKKRNEQNEKKRLVAVRLTAEDLKSTRNGCSKTAALKTSREFLRKAKKPTRNFNKVQRQTQYQITRYKQQERLKISKRMEQEQNAALVSKEFDISPGIVTKWYRRYKDGGVKNLDDLSRAPHNTPHKSVFKKQEIWIRELHSKGLELKEIQKELQRQYDFEITEGGLYGVLKRLNLILPCSSKNRLVKRNRKAACKNRKYPHRKIYNEQEKWILDLHAEGFNNNRIKAELLNRFCFRIGNWAIREVLLKHKILYPKTSKR